MAIWLNQQDVASLISVPDAIPVIEAAFGQLANGNVMMPQRVGFAGDGGGGAAMPAYVAGDNGGLAVKVVALFEGNAARGLPVVNATLLLLEHDTGRLLAVMDAGYLTAVRTGAVGGVAAKYLARADARTVTIFGAGTQARTQLEAACAVRKIDEVHVVDAVPEAARRFAKEMGAKLDVEAVVAEDIRSVVEIADIIITATTAHQPVFDGSWLKPGVHINGIGSHAAAWRELDSLAVSRSRIIADQTAACLAEAGDLIIAIEEGAIRESDIHAELGEVITERIEGRTDAGQITLFKSVGLAIQDVAAAARVYKNALVRGVGLELTEGVS